MCESLICQRHQTILRFLSTVATASTWWRVREIYCQTSYIPCTLSLLLVTNIPDHFAFCLLICLQPTELAYQSTCSCLSYQRNFVFIFSYQQTLLYLHLFNHALPIDAACLPIYPSALSNIIKFVNQFMLSSINITTKQRE
jgi:hypothetical protein